MTPSFRLLLVAFATGIWTLMPVEGYASGAGGESVLPASIRAVTDTIDRKALLAQLASNSQGVTRAVAWLEYAEISWLLRQKDQAARAVGNIDFSALDGPLLGRAVQLRQLLHKARSEP